MNLCGRPTGYVLLGSGILTFLFSVILYVSFDHVFRFAVNKKVALSPTSNGYPIWKDVSKHFDTETWVYFFNVTNPNAVIKGESPKLVQVGPYVYRAQVSKDNIVFNDNNTVSFRENKIFHFVPESSNGTEDDIIQIINVPLLSAAIKMKDYSWWSRSAAVLALSALADNLFINRTVRELTFEGYSDGIVSMNALKSGGPSKFGFMVEKNGTNPGEFTMYTGKDSPLNVNRVNTVKGLSNLGVWEGEECNKVRGTFGYVRPPFTQDKTQHVYVPDMCRPFRLAVGDTIKYRGLTMRRLEMTKETMARGDENVENSCYGDRFGLPSGAQDIGPCKKGAPVIVSQPHFLNADPSYLEYAPDLRPNASSHGFVMLSEPTTGITLSVRGRIQVNVYVEPMDILGFDDFKKGVMPLFWNEMYVEAKDDVVNFVKRVVGIPDTGRTMCIVVMCISLVLVTVGAFLIWRSYRIDRNARFDRVTYTKAKTNGSTAQKV